MSAENKIVSATEFLQMFKDRNGMVDFKDDMRIVVQGDVVISSGMLSPKPDDMAQDPTISFINIDFRDHVSIKDISPKNLRFLKTNFHAGLNIENVRTSLILIGFCQLQFLTAYTSQCVRLRLINVTGINDRPPEESVVFLCDYINISSLCVLSYATIKGVNTFDLSLVAEGSLFRALFVDVDDVAYAMQLHLLGIPVNVSTEVARKFLAEIS